MAGAQTFAQRFWSKVDRGEGDACWPWMAGVSEKGYGRIWDGRVMANAHRVSWEFANGPIPEGMFVCHRCDNPRCVRPDHLFPGTAAENSGDMVAKGRGAGPRGARNRNTKLDPGSVQAIRAALGAGESYAAIAARFGVGKGVVGQIRHRATWRHVGS